MTGSGPSPDSPTPVPKSRLSRGHLHTARITAQARPPTRLATAKTLSFHDVESRASPPWLPGPVLGRVPRRLAGAAARRSESHSHVDAEGRAPPGPRHGSQVLRGRAGPARPRARRDRDVSARGREADGRAGAPRPALPGEVRR